MRKSIITMVFFVFTALVTYAAATGETIFL